MKQWIKAHLGLWILALAAVLVAGVMLVPRMQAEQANMTYDIIVDYKDFQNLSQQSKYDISWWMHYLNDLGLEKVALFESTLDSLGKDPTVPVDVWDLAELRKTSGWSATLPEEIVKAVLASGSNYDVIVACYDSGAAEWIINNMTARLDEFEYTAAQKDGLYCLYIPASRERNLRLLPLGFWPGTVEMLREAGMTVLPRTTTIKGLNGERFLTAVLESFRALNPDPQYFFGGDDGLPGYDAPEMALRVMEEYFADVHLLATECADQRGNLTWPGFNEIITKMNYNTVRMFNEWDYIQWRYQYYSYGSSEEIVNSFFRAVAERNCRVIYLRAILDTDEEEVYIVDPEPYELMVTDTMARLADHGFTFGDVEPMTVVSQPTGLRILLGICSVAAAVLLLCTVFPIKPLGQWLLVLIGSAGVVGAFLVLGQTANLLLNIAAGIVYPTLAMLVLLRALRDYKPLGSSWRILALSVVGMLLCVFLSMIGALVSTAALSETAYLLEFRLYRAVKLMQIVPIGLYVLAYLYLLLPGELNLQIPREYKALRAWLRDGLERPVKLRWVAWAMLAAALIGVAGLAGLYYIVRTGNTVGGASTVELMIRNFLEEKLVARPRTKEFLIGVPCMMWFIYLCARRWRLLPIFVGLGMAIGATSFVNTFLHLRSPLNLSFARTGYAVAFGLVIGLVGIAVLELLRYFWKKGRKTDV